MRDNLREALTELLDRAQADGGAVVPIDVLRDLLGDRNRWYVAEHQILFPGPTHTWLMRHPDDCTGLACPVAKTARRQFPAHDGCHGPGEFTAVPTEDGRHLITVPIIQIGQTR